MATRGLKNVQDQLFWSLLVGAACPCGPKASFSMGKPLPSLKIPINYGPIPCFLSMKKGGRNGAKKAQECAGSIVWAYVGWCCMLLWSPGVIFHGQTTASCRIPIKYGDSAPSRSEGEKNVAKRAQERAGSIAWAYVGWRRMFLWSQGAIFHGQTAAVFRNFHKLWGYPLPFEHEGKGKKWCRGGS